MKLPSTSGRGVMLAIIAMLVSSCGESDPARADDHSKKADDSASASGGEHASRPSKVAEREMSADEKGWREANLEKSYVGKVRSMGVMEVIAEFEAGRISTLQQFKALFPKGSSGNKIEGVFTHSVHIEGKTFIIVWADKSGSLTGWQARDSY
ncbi:hypothetical protein [Luteolibacter soli]|uniref:Lipoprotein n=1 Tax=Luteolibacter soli TaxID=3135280 RepID=A0ABU9AQ60_9BACT